MDAKPQGKHAPTMCFVEILVSDSTAAHLFTFCWSALLRRSISDEERLRAAYAECDLVNDSLPLTWPPDWARAHGITFADYEKVLRRETEAWWPDRPHP